MNTRQRLALVLAVLALALGCSERSAPSEAQHNSPHAGAPEQPNTVTTPGGHVAHHAALEVHATFWMHVDSSSAADAITQRLTAFADAQQGWVQAASLGVSEGSSHVTLRVPPSSINALRTMLERSAGASGNLHEETTSTDVTEALADLDARLRAARATEVALLALLDQRTGSLADVLAAERALGDERAQIEQLESTQRNAQGRVDEATVNVWLEMRGGRAVQPLGRRVTQAAHDGLDAARGLVVGTVLLTLEAGPTLLLLALGVFVCWRLVRLLRRRQA